MASEMDQLTLRIAGEALFSEGFEADSDNIAQWNEAINHYCAKPPLPIIRSFWFPSPANRKIKSTLAAFHSFIHSMIEKRRAEGTQADLLGVLLQARHEETDSAQTDAEITEEVLGMILGGHTIPAGSIVLFNRHALHRHPDFWKQPERFNPQRQDPDNLENARSTYAQVPFGGGPRICMGINFAVMELVLIVATVCQRYKVRLAKEHRHQMSAKMTMAPKYGVNVFLEPRS